KAVELVPLIVDRVDPAALRAEEIAAQLQVVRRIREDYVAALVGQTRHLRNAVAHQDFVERKLTLRLGTGTRAQSAPGLRNAGNKVHADVPPLRLKGRPAHVAGAQQR